MYLCNDGKYDYVLQSNVWPDYFKFTVVLWTIFKSSCLK